MKNILIAFAFLLSFVAGRLFTGPPAANTVEIFVNGSAGSDTNSERTATQLKHWPRRLKS